MINEDSDLDAIFSLNGFAEEVTVGGNKVNAMFNQPTETSFGGEVVVTKPSLTVKSSDMAGIPKGSIAVIRGVTYTVEKIERSGVGMSVLKLKT